MEPQGLPQDRVAKVKPFWASVSQDDRLKLLSIPLSKLKQRAAEVGARQRKEQAELVQLHAELVIKKLDEARLPCTYKGLKGYPTMDELLSVVIQRLQENKSWKLWKWPPAAKEFLNATEFRLCIKENFIDEKLRHLLPHNEGSSSEKAAQEAFRLRMTEVLKAVKDLIRQLQEEQVARRQTDPRGRGSPEQLQDLARSCSLEQIHVVMQALEKENEHLARTVREPLTAFICEMLPEHMRKTSRMKLMYEDFESLPKLVLKHIAEWLTQKVDCLTLETCAAPQEAEDEAEEQASDVDHFILNEEGDCLQINPRWLQYLQSRLGETQHKFQEDGHPCNNEACNIGLSLEYVFGGFKSSAGKACAGAKLCLSSLHPSAVKAHEDLVAALNDMHTWEEQRRNAEFLLEQMLLSRSEAEELKPSEKYDTRPKPTAPGPRTSLPGINGLSEQNTEAMASPADLPEHIIMPRREKLLATAQVTVLIYDHETGEHQLERINTELRQGGCRFECLKRSLDYVDNELCGLEGTSDTSAETDRHRDQLIKEQVEVQTAFREHGAYLQGIRAQGQHVEQDRAARNQEIKRLQGWIQTLSYLQIRLGCAMEGAVAVGLGNFFPGIQASDQTASEALSNTRAEFQNDLRRRLCSNDDHNKTYKCIQEQLQDITERLAEGWAVLFHLQSQLVHVACDDPGAVIGE